MRSRPRISTPFSDRTTRRAQRNPAPTRQPVVEHLQPRFLLSADSPLLDLVAPDRSPDAVIDVDRILRSVEQQLRELNDPFERSVGNAHHPDNALNSPGAGIVDSELSSHQISTLIVLDSRVPGFQTLVDDIQKRRTDNDSTAILVLDAERDGPRQILEELARIGEVDALHIVSHGSDSHLQLGQSVVGTEQLQGQSSMFKQWGDYLSTDADILIYGCQLAETDQGRQFVDSLARLTGADVAASEDRTGSSALAGNWHLEYQSGSVAQHELISLDMQDRFASVLNTYTVTNVSDSGAGSLRQAITDSNLSVGADLINFNIAGAGPHVINLLSALPSITDTVTIDGTTEPDFNSNGNQPVVVIDGGGTILNGLTFSSSSDNSVVKGLVIRDLGTHAIAVEAGADGINITGNYLGSFDINGKFSSGDQIGNTIVYIEGANAVVGGTDEADRNVISGGLNGVVVSGFSATGAQIGGNYIGTDAAGKQSITIDVDGVRIENGATGAMVGGVTAAHGNLVSSSAMLHGISIADESSDNNTIQNNRIGVAADGLTPVGVAEVGITIYYGADNTQILDNNVVASEIGIEINGASVNTIIQGNVLGTDPSETYQWGLSEAGVQVSNGATSTQIGGVLPGEGNVIAYTGLSARNEGVGVAVLDTSTATISGNSIYGSFGAGIDLSVSADDGWDQNDTLDLDSGGNGKQNWATVNAAALNGANLDIDLDASTLTLGIYTADFYVSDDLDGGVVEGKTYLSSALIVGGAAATGSISAAGVTAGDLLTLTITDALGRTSEFSNYMVVKTGTPSGAAPVELDITTSDIGGLSLNQNGGDSSYLVADDGGAILGGAADFTIEIQTTLDSSPTFPHLIDYVVDGENSEFSLLLSGDTVRVSVGGTGVGFAGNYAQLRDGDTHAIAVTRDASSGDMSLYIDGIFQETLVGIRPGLTLATGGILVIGNDQDIPGSQFQTNQAVKGTLQSVRIFDDIRTDVEIQTSYASSVPYTESGLLASWQFDELSSDDQVLDSVSGNNLTLAEILEPGFTASNSGLVLSVNENAFAGTMVGAVTATDIEREALIAAMLADNPSLYFRADTGKFYHYIDTGFNWLDARNNALGTTLNGVAGQLVTIESATENRLVTEILDLHGASQAYINASDSAVEGEWRLGDQNDDALFWLGNGSGQLIGNNFANWDGSNPDDSGGDQDYAKIFASTGLWDDVPGNSTQKSIVEFDADAVLASAGPYGQQAISYSLASQTVAGTFSVTTDGNILVADGTRLDFESLTTHNLTIRSTDSDGNTYDQVIAVELRDLFENSPAPTDLAGGIDLNTDGGNNAYLASADPTSVFDSVTSELTLEVSFSLELEHEKDSPLLSYANADGADAVTLIVRADASVAFAINNQTLVTSPYAELRDGEQHMLSVSWDSDNGDVSLYIDGRLVETVTGHQAGEVISAGGVLVFGQEQDSVGGGFTTDEVFSGTYYETRIWSEVRSADEISLNYQHRLSSGALPSALAAYWKMDGFNGSNEVVESVAAENLRIDNVAGSGFSTSSPAESLTVAENSADGSSVSVVIPEDSVLHQDLVRDGRFLEADSGGWTTYTQGQTFGGWRVVAGSVDHSSQFPSPLGGVGIDLERGVGDPGGVIAQTLSTEVGREYQIIFSATGNFSGSGDPVKFMRVSAAGVAQDFAITDTSVYETYSLRFTATSTSTELFLQGLDDSGFGAVVSDVRVLTIPDAITGILASDSDLHYDAGTGKFYKVVTSPADWISAQSLAAADKINGVGGQLVNILSQYENDLVQDMVTGKGSTFLIGATDATLEGNWNWLNNGEESESFWIGDGSGYSPTGTYSNFQSPEPDSNGGAEEDYAGMVASSGSWFDRGTGADNYIIEWDAGEVLGSYSFSLSDDAGGRFSIDETTGEITVADGSLLDFESQTAHVVDVDVIDAAGNGYSESLTIEVENLGAEPTQILPAPQVLPDSNLSLIFSLAGGNPVSVSDTDAGTDMRLQVTLEVSDGILSLSGTNGLLIPAGSNGSSSFTIQGTESDINAALEGMTFTPDVGFSGVVNLSMSTSLAVGLEGHYTFDGGDSDDQSVGSPQHGILSGGAAVTTDGTRGDVASLDGIDDFVLINSLFDSPADVTLAAWVDLDSIGTFGSDVISLGDNVMLRLDSDVGGLSLWYFNGSSFVSVTTDIYLEGTGWHHVAASFDDTGDQVSIYLNGESIKSESTTDSIVYSLGSSTLIGAHGNWANTYYFGGKIDDARIYSRVLSVAEVAVLARDRGSVSSSTTITVNAVNDIPVFSSLDGGQTYEEGTQPVIIDPNVAIFDAELSALDNYAGASLEIVRSGGADSNDVFSAVGSLSPLTQGGALTLSGVMIGTVDHNTSGKLQLTFNSNATEARVVETLRSLAYSNVSDSPSNSIVLNWTFRDGNSGAQGTGGEGQATGNALVNIALINDVASATDDLAVTTEDSSLVINPLANDSDAENDPLTLLDVAQPTNGVVSNNGDGTLTYTPQSNFHGTDAVDYLLIDAGTGLQHYWGLNGQAVDAAGGADGVLAGASQSNGDFGGALIFDEIDDHVVLPDIVYGSEFSISLEFKVKEINGSLYQYLYSHGDLNATNSINIFINENAHSSDPAVLRTVVRDGDDTLDHTTLQFDISTLVGDDLWHNYTLVAGADGLSVYLDGVLVATDATRGADVVNPTGAAMLGARFDLDNAQRYGGALDSVQVFNRALSAPEVGSLTSAENSATVNLTINSVNDAPLSVSVSNTVLNENTDTGSGFTVGFLTSTDDDSGDTFTYTVVGGADSAVFSIGGAASDELVITAGVLDHESQSSYSVVIRTTDAAGASHDETLTITITDLNEAPQVLSLSNSAIAENTDTTGGVVMGNLSGIDPDAGDTLTFSIAGGPDASVFSIGGAGLDELVITDGVLDFEAKATYSVTVRSTDTGGLFREQVFVVNVVDGNEQPTTVSLSNSTVSENTDSSAGYSVGTLSTTDQDIGDSFTYSIVGGADAGVLSIGGINTDELVLTDGTLDYERQTSYTVIVRTTDAGGLTRDQVLSVSVLDINEAPYSLTISNQLVSESSDASAGLSVGVLSTLDSDNGDSFTYTVIGGPDAGLFSIEGADSNELVITVGALDFESQSIYSVTVRSTDASGLFFDQVLLISVADQNEAPYFASFPPGPASTGTPYSYAIVAQDQDADDVLSISANLLPDWLDLESSGSGSALLSGTPSATDLGSHTVELVVTDGSLTAIQNFTVIVSNPDAPPVITSGDGSESHFLTLQENQALITTVTAEDADPEDVLTYSVSGGDDAGRFEIDATSGVLRFLIAPDFEAPQDHDTDSIYTAEITVADATGKVDSQLISVQIIDVNEPITSVTLDNTVVVENTDAADGLVVGTFSVSDQDLVDSVSYTIVGGADAASFSIGGPQLDLLMLTHNALDFETQPLLEVTVQATDSGGNGFDQSLEIGIADLNEPPQLLSAPAVLATEDSQYSYTLAATDPDAGAQLVLSVETLPQWLSLAAQSEHTWTLTGLPVNADVGDHLVSLQVSDGELSVPQQFTVAVENVNNAPAITSSGGAELVDLVVNEFTNTVATFSASDIDLDSQLVYSITGGEDAPSFSIDPEQGILAFVITPDSIRPIDSNGDGIYLVEVTVSDQNGAADTQVVRISTGLQNGWEPSIVPVQGNLHQYEPVATIIVPADTQVKPEKDSDETVSPDKVVDSRQNPETEPTPLSETQLQFPAQPLPLEFTVASVQGTRAGSASATDADLTQSNDTNVLRKILRIWQSQSLESLELQLGEQENSRFYRELDEQMEEMDSLAESENKKNKLIAQVATGVSITLTAGFVSWVLRAGSLVASLLSNMPIWRQMDVLPILSDREDGRGRLGDTVDGEAPVQTPSVTGADDKAEDLFRFRR